MAVNRKVLDFEMVWLKPIDNAVFNPLTKVNGNDDNHSQCAYPLPSALADGLILKQDLGFSQTVHLSFHRWDK